MVFIANTKTLQGNDLVSSSNLVSGLVYKKRSDVVYYFGLRTMNDSLLNENALLRKKLDQISSLDTLKDSFVVKKPSLTDTSGKPRKRIKELDSNSRIIKYADYIYRNARVINNSTNASDNYVTINRGSKEGVAKYMAVISGTGIVGRVEHVSAHFASVLSILSSKQKVSAKLKDGTNGYIIWEEKIPDMLIMTDVPQQAKVKKGDSIFTTGYSFFPPDIMIGTVLKVETIKKNNLQNLYLQSSTNFKNLQYVYVVENKMSPEKKQLEDSSLKK